MIDLKKNIVSNSITVLDALNVINEIGVSGYQTLFVNDAKGVLAGTVTDGDIRRAIIDGVRVEENIERAMCSNFRYLTKDSFSLDEIINLKKSRIFLVPLLDEHKRIIRIIDFNTQRSILPVDSVIMAGGKGERLLPLTLDTPKPLLKIGDKAIIERNVERLASFGIEHITITTGYLSDKLISFFNDKKYNTSSLAFTVEDKKLGTIGGLSLIKDFYHDIVFVMNADILTNIDIEDFLLNFIDAGCDISVATIPYKVSVPYAVLETDHHEITSIIEKPVYTYYANAGIYLIKRSVLGFIPSDVPFDATDLISESLSRGLKVHHYPIKGYWLDIGKPDDYLKAQEDIKLLADE